MRYNLQQSAHHKYRWVLADTEKGVVIEFDEGNFNDSQKVTELGIYENNPLGMAETVREMTEWLAENHYEIVFSSPQRIKEHYRICIGEEIRDIRKSVGLTTRELARLTGLTHSHIVRIENGKYNVTLDTLAVIADALGVQIIID